MKKYYPSSAFRLLLIFLLNANCFDIWLLILSVLYLGLFHRKDILYFLFFMALFLGRCHIKYPLLHEGVVIGRTANIYLIRNDFYDVELLTSRDIPIGAFVSFEASSARDYHEEENSKKLSRNIMYRLQAEKVVATEQFNEANFKKYIYHHSSQAKAFLLRFLCGETDYDYAESFLFIGFSMMHLCGLLLKMKQGVKWTAFYLLAHCLCFGARMQLFFLIFLWLGALFNWNRSETLLASVFALAMVQPHYLRSGSFFIYFLFFAMNSLHLPLSSSLFFYYTEMQLSNGIHFLRLLCWPLFRKISFFLYFLALFSLFFIWMDPFLIAVTDLLRYFFLHCDYFLVGKLTLPFFLLYLLVLSAFSIKRKTVSLLILSLFLIGRIQAPACGFHFIDVGHGDATYFEDRSRNFKMLIDTGDAFHYKEVKAFLHGMGVNELDVLMISHGDADHAANKEALISDFHVKKVIEKQGQSFAKNGCKWHFLPTGDADNENDRSLVYYSAIDKRPFLFTGDISAHIETRIIKNYAPFELFFVKGAHHGSNTSSSAWFLDNLQPKLVSISASGKYNHPSPATLQRYKQRNIRYFVTKNEGTIHYLFFRFFDLLYTDRGNFIFIPKSNK